MTENTLEELTRERHEIEEELYDEEVVLAAYMANGSFEPHEPKTSIRANGHLGIGRSSKRSNLGWKQVGTCKEKDTWDGLYRHLLAGSAPKRRVEGRSLYGTARRL